MKFNEADFLSAIGQSFKMYKLKGARSNAKLRPIHLFVADTLSAIWGKEFEVSYLGEGSRELKVEGKYYPKNVDVAITDNGKVVFCVGIKFVTSNYKQNANNYFENMMGETANIQAMDNIPYAQLIILRLETPYYKKNETDLAAKTEIINKKDLLKYIKLKYDSPQAHRPMMLGVLLVSIDEETQTAKAVDLDAYFDKDFAQLLKKQLSLKNFFSDISYYKNFYKNK
jgi:hypothetical protein